MELIRHEMAHLQAFEELATEEGITDEIALRFVETFDAAMTEEAWIRLKGAYDAMRSDHGDDNDMIKQIKLIEEPSEAEDFTQMKGTRAAVVHPSAQV
jgi:plasmid maintenance system antidote protein VapI